MNNILQVDKLFYKVEDSSLLGLNKREKTILKNITFNLERGGILGIAGESGSGKTTLAKILAGALPNYEGTISFNISEEWKKLKVSPVQILFQNNGEILNPLRSVNSIVEEAIFIRTNNKKIIADEKGKIFASLNFPDELWNRKGYELSGGEQQRAALARIMAVNPEILILDEPFSAQDAESQLNLLTLFKNINKSFGTTMICIAHNLKILRKLCDRVLILYKGEIVEQGNTEKILSSPQHPYTGFLLNAENYNLTYEELKTISLKT